MRPLPTPEELVMAARKNLEQRGSVYIDRETLEQFDAADLGAGAVLTCMANVTAKAISWLWMFFFPLGRISLIVGRPGCGKSFLTCDIAARVSKGTPWPDGSECPQGSVILVSAEDDPADTIKPRLEAHLADCSKVHLLAASRWVDSDGQLQERMFTLADLPTLEDALQRNPDCKLVVIDPIGSYLGGQTDSHRDNEVRAVLAPLAKLAEKYQVAVIIVCHTRKASAIFADDTALGSRAFTGIARAVWHLTKDPENKRRRLFLPGKNNLAEEPDGLAFDIGGEPACLRWEAEPVKMSADDVMGEKEHKPGPEPKERNAAAVWLAGLLVDGQVPAATVRAEAKAAGMNYRTAQRAADAMGLLREKCRFTGGWIWREPKVTSEGDNQNQSVHLSPSQKSREYEDFHTPNAEGDKLNSLVAFDPDSDLEGGAQ